MSDQVGEGHVAHCPQLRTVVNRSGPAGPEKGRVSCFFDMTFKERLQQAAAHAKVTWGQTAIATSLGFRKQTVDRWFDTGEPKPEQLFAIADKWKVDARWLATGRGQMLTAGQGSRLEHHEDELLKRYRDADPRWQLSLRLLAALATEDQIEASTDVNMVIARIFGKKPADLKYPPDSKVRAFKGDAPHVVARKRVPHK